MPVDKIHIMDLVDGHFSQTNKTDLETSLSAFQANPEIQNRLVLHFHGGLVSRTSAHDSASVLLPVYRDRAKAFPLFFIWNSFGSDFFTGNTDDALTEILRQIGTEDTIFTLVQNKLLGFLTGLLRPTANARGGLVEVLPEVTVEKEKKQVAHEPFSTIRPSSEQARSLTFDEEEQLRQHLETSNLAELVVAAAQIDTPSEGSEGFRSAIPLPLVGGKTYLSPEILAEVRAGESAEQTRGLPGWAVFLQHGIEIANTVLKRFRDGRDHGLYCTVIEEILRKLYLAAVGEGVWNIMKGDTADAFGDDPNCGGTAFLKELDTLVRQRQATGAALPEITLVGHSTGALYIGHFLEKAENLLPPEQQFRIVLLAPACTLDFFVSHYLKFSPRIADLRLLGMQDAVEKADVCVPILYTRSLLYLVSGICEPEVDIPLAGMQRFHNSTFQPAPPPEALAYLAPRTAWSEENTGPGRRTNSHHHGDFDDADALTHTSLVELITLPTPWP